MGEYHFLLSLVKKYRIVLSLFLTCLLLIAFYFFSVKVKQERFNKINFDTTIRLQYKIPDKIGGLFDDLIFFVSPEFSVIAIIILTGIACIDVKKKKLKWKGLIIPLAFLCLVGLEVYGKGRVESPAPPYFMIKNPTTIFPKYHVIDQYSYPSGHASRALFIGVISIMVCFKFIYKKLGILGIIGLIAVVSLMILSVSIGKIYLGHHWISDIIGGWILAASMLCFVFPFIIPEKKYD